MARDIRVFMVMAEDALGDGHLFTTHDIGRARAAMEQMERQYVRVRGNWQEQDAEQPVLSPV